MRQLLRGAGRIAVRGTWRQDEGADALLRFGLRVIALAWTLNPGNIAGSPSISSASSRST